MTNYETLQHNLKHEMSKASFIATFMFLAYVDRNIIKCKRVATSQQLALVSQIHIGYRQYFPDTFSSMRGYCNEHCQFS